MAVAASLIAVALLAWLLERLGPRADDELIVEEPVELAIRRRIAANREKLRRDAEERERIRQRAPDAVRLSDEEARRILQSRHGMRVTDGEA